MFDCVCKFCNNHFESKQPSTVICEDCKSRPCEICGKSFVRVWPYDQKCCSKECRKAWINRPEHKAAANAKRDETVRMRYGVSNVNELSSVKGKISKSKTDKEVYFEERKQEIEASKKPIIRQCVICGKDFEATGNQTTCSGPHYKKCVVCGKQFEFEHVSDKRQTCSQECYSALIRQNTESVKKVCEYCKKEFYTIYPNARYCPGPHYKVCEICGKKFEVDPTLTGLEYVPRACSIECRTKLSEKTCMRRYGYHRASMRPEAVEEARKTAFEREEQRKETNMQKFGYPYASQHPDLRKNLSEKISSEEVKKKTRDTMMARYGVEYIMQSPEFARAHSTSQFSQVACDGTRVDSRWEALFYDFLVRNNIEFEYNTYHIDYEYNGQHHRTHIDFKIGDLLLEVKGSHLLKGAFSDAPGVIPIGVKLDQYRKNHVIVITDTSCADMFGPPNSAVSNGLKYLDKCPEPLIGIDISLFDHPEFPYAEDRPPCFYDVKVDGSRSSFEAFYDESIRWKMILNRINYSGGFIDAKQILTAMNVTRTCKQPSWFSKSFAISIIKKYCTSSTIVDCFAGWGTRHDAAVELRRDYVGIDFNPQLVRWHQQNNRNIEFGDANEFCYEGECSVFICPPYSDPRTGRCFEDYNFSGFDASAKALSQCDWLKIVMQNVPNAKEYVMICKIIDPGFEKFVVETIDNKSHLGVNHEYVLVVKNEYTVNR